MIDEGAKVDTAILAGISGHAAEVKFVSDMLACMPAPNVKQHREPETVLQRLEALRTSESFRLAPRTAQHQLKHVQKLVGGLVEDKCINVASALANSQLKPVVQRFQYFVRSYDDEKKQWTYGESAMTHLYGIACEKAETGTATSADVHSLGMYKWLRPANLVDPIRSLITRVKKQQE